MGALWSRASAGAPDAKRLPEEPVPPGAGNGAAAFGTEAPRKRVRDAAPNGRTDAQPPRAAGTAAPAKRPRTDGRDNRVPDVAVKPGHLVRVRRDADGALHWEPGATPLYADGFLASLPGPPPREPASRADALAARGAGEVALRGLAGADAGAGGTDGPAPFIGHGLKRALRKREVAFPRSAAAVPAVLATAEPTTPYLPAAGAEGAPAERAAGAVDVRGKLYLAPLTTVGNLPFRRVCKRLGADVTCGEMALAPALLRGQGSEWALLRRHASEDVFGAQIAGGNVETVARAAELVAREARVDFLELNAGCPIDGVFNRGGGCALMARRAKLCRMVAAAAAVADVPLGVKLRTGVAPAAPTAHALIPALARAGAAWVTVHGRSRKQRYSRAADWGYITGPCRAAARTAGIPLLGNGDVYNWEDAARAVDAGEVDGAMLARGALIKPWLLTEIKERRHWDIRSTERLDIVRELASAGLDHWGADERGVATARRFMLEWLSFAYRYVPIGIQDAEPAGLAARAPFFRGRDDLETLLGSPDSRDWVRITEMVYGPAPPGFSFTPRHKSNAWG